MTQKYVGSGLREKFICHKRLYLLMKCIKKELSRSKEIQQICRPIELKTCCFDYA